MSDTAPAFDEDELSHRVARNEARFRQINEVIESGRDRDDDVHPIGFVCECGLPDCARIIEMTPAEYERVRASAVRFIVVEGHEIPEVERVIASTERYAIVEKLEPGASIAEETDQRSS